MIEAKPMMPIVSFPNENKCQHCGADICDTVVPGSLVGGTKTEQPHR